VTVELKMIFLDNLRWNDPLTSTSAVKTYDCRTQVRVRMFSQNECLYKLSLPPR